MVTGEVKAFLQYVSLVPAQVSNIKLFILGNSTTWEDEQVKKKTTQKQPTKKMAQKRKPPQSKKDTELWRSLRNVYINIKLSYDSTAYSARMCF